MSFNIGMLESWLLQVWVLMYGAEKYRHRELLPCPDKRLRHLQGILEQWTLITHLFQLLIGISFPDLLF